MSTGRVAPRITIFGISELGEYSAVRVTHVLSLLGPNAADPQEFASFAPHRRLILRFHDVIEPAPDQTAPASPNEAAILSALETILRKNSKACWGSNGAAIGDPTPCRTRNPRFAFAQDAGRGAPRLQRTGIRRILLKA
jgi:hypothetical protein